jgi:hypothetical protein
LLKKAEPFSVAACSINRAVCRDIQHSFCDSSFSTPNELQGAANAVQIKTKMLGAPCHEQKDDYASKFVLLLLRGITTRRVAMNLLCI